MTNQNQAQKDDTFLAIPPQSTIQFNETSNKTEFWHQVLEPELRKATPADFKPNQLLHVAVLYAKLAEALRLSAALLRSRKFRKQADIPINAFELMPPGVEFMPAEQRERLADIYTRWERHLCLASTLAEQAAGIPNN